MKINHNTNTGTTKAVNAVTPTYTSFGLKVDEPSECIITNLATPMGRDETVRYAHFAVDNVYKNSGIQILEQQPVKSGVKVVCSVRQNWSLTAETEAEKAPDYILPVTAQITLTVPNNQYIAATDLEKIILQAVGALYTSDGASKIASLVRGSMKPSNI